MKIYRRLRRSAITASRRPSAQRRAQQLRLLQEVSHQIAAALDVQEVLDRLVQSICATLGYQLVAAALVEGDQLAFWSSATKLDVVLPPRPDFFPLDGLGLTTWAARHGETVLVGDVLADPRYLWHDLFPMTRSELTVPLVGRSGVLGIIDLQSDRPHAFDCHDIDLMQTLAEHAATAIENARLYQAEQQRRRELEELQSIALKLGGDLDLDTVLRTVVEGVASVFNADAASVLMPDPTSDTLIVRAHAHLPDVYA
ncbi:MAG TPA: GAF domain-containing protein, partial [Roseiflexaceae bacterium]